MKTGYIYLITNKTNGHKYVGQTTQSIEKRWAQHVQESKYDRSLDTTLYKAMRLYGCDNFSIEKIYEVRASDVKSLIDALNDLEIKAIDAHNTYHDGYNMTRGGRDYEHLTVRVARYDLLGNLTKTYSSIKETEDDGFTHSSVSAACRGKLLTHGGYIWEYIDNDEIPTLVDVPRRRSARPMRIGVYSLDGRLVDTATSLLDVRTRYGIPLTTKIVEDGHQFKGYIFTKFDNEPEPKLSNTKVRVKEVCQLASDGSVIATYPSIKSASLITGINAKSISKVCLGDRDNAGGFKWKLAREIKEEYFEK